MDVQSGIRDMDVQSGFLLSIYKDWGSQEQRAYLSRSFDAVLMIRNNTAPRYLYPSLGGARWPPRRSVNAVRY